MPKPPSTKAKVANLQVIYATEPIDEPCLLALEKFGEHALMDVSREGLDLGEEGEDKKKVGASALPQRSPRDTEPA